MNILSDSLETKVSKLYPLLHSNVSITLPPDTPLALARMAVELEISIRDMHVAIITNVQDIDTLDYYYKQLDTKLVYIRPICDMLTFIKLKDYVALFKALELIDTRVYRGICLDLCHLYSSKIYQYKNLKPYKIQIGDEFYPALYETSLLELCANYLVAVAKTDDVSMFHDEIVKELTDKIKEFKNLSIKAVKIKNSSALYTRNDNNEKDINYVDKTVNLYSFEATLNILGGFISSLYPSALSRSTTDALEEQLREAEDTISLLSSYKNVVVEQGYILKELFGQNFSIANDVEVQVKGLKEHLSSKTKELELQKRIEELEKKVDTKDKSLKKMQDKLNLANKRISCIYEDAEVEEEIEEEPIELDTIISALNNKFVLLVGGHTSLEEKLKNLGYTGFERIQNHNNAAFSNASSARPNYDLVVLNTKYISHSTVRGIEKRYDNIIYFNGTNVDALLRSIYDNIIELS